MKKFFTNQNYTYKKLTYSSSDKNREQRFENSILRLKDNIFPNHYCEKWNYPIKFKSNDSGKIHPGLEKKPDLVLIDKTFDHWVVVEVETTLDKISAVRGQLQTFSQGDYHISGYLNSLEKTFENYKNIKRENLRDLLLNKRTPKVLCIFDEENKEYSDMCKQLEVDVMVLNIFKVENTNSIFRKDELFNLAEIITPPFLNDEKDEYELIRDRGVHQDFQGKINMYISGDSRSIIKNGTFIKINKGKHLKGLKFKEEYLEIKTNEKDKIYLEFTNSPLLHSSNLDTLTIKRIESRKNTFLLEPKKKH